MRPILTPRQLQCLAWVQCGKSSTDIGAILGISAGTVDKHMAHICEILDVRTRMQAVVRALELGLLPHGDPDRARATGLISPAETASAR